MHPMARTTHHHAQHDDDNTNMDGPSSSSSSSDSSMSVIYDLIELRDWDGVTRLLQGVPEACSQARSLTGNLALHEVCKYQPPLSVVNLLLKIHEDAIRTHGQYGYLPLHFACSNRASFDVVDQLIDVYPAATRCRDEIDDALPIHLAAQWGASEDVLMEILTVHPEGSFMRDSSGKTPMDHAEQLQMDEEEDDDNVDVRTYAMNALATAPILVATAKAASARANREWETRIKGVKEAHAEYIRQMEEMHDEEKTSFLVLELQFNNELSEEKERNIVLAERLIEGKTRAEELMAERDEARILREQEAAEFHYRFETHERELSAIIAGSVGHQEGTNKSVSISQQLTDLATRYKETKTQMDTMAKEQAYNGNMAKHLNQLLSSKDEEIEALTKKLQETETAQHTAAERADRLAHLQDGTQQQLKSTKDEMNRLKELTDMQNQQLIQTNRMLHVQESRLGGIKSLVSSLSYNIEAWSIDDNDDWDQKTASTKSSTTVVEGLETVKLKLKDSTYGRINNNASCATIVSPQKDCDNKSSGAATLDTSVMVDENSHEDTYRYDEDVSTLSPSPSPARFSTLSPSPSPARPLRRSPSPSPARPLRRRRQQAII